MPARSLVSIVTPTFNHEGFIGSCIESVQAQTFPHWEMIIVDDGSTDGTASVARRYAESDDRIKVFVRENVGILRLAETYNFGLEHSAGEWIAVLEGDDVWLPNKLQIQLDAVAANPDAVLSWGDITITSRSLKPIGVSRSTAANRDERHFDNRPVGSLLNDLYIENIVSATTLVIKRTELDAIGGFQRYDGLPLIDYPTILALVVRGPFAYVPESLAQWRWHPDQVTKSYYSQIIERVRDLSLEHFDSLDESVRQHVHVTRAQIESRYRDSMRKSYVQSGRYRLVQKRYGDARRDFWKALFHPSLSGNVDRLIALIGIGSSLFGQDLEWLARMMGKKPIS